MLSFVRGSWDRGTWAVGVGRCLVAAAAACHRAPCLQLHCAAIPARAREPYQLGLQTTVVGTRRVTTTTPITALRNTRYFTAATDGADILRGGSGCARPVQHPGRAVSQAARSGGRRSSRRWAAHAQFCVRPERRHGALTTRVLSGEKTSESDYVTSLCEHAKLFAHQNSPGAGGDAQPALWTIVP